MEELTDAAAEGSGMELGSAEQDAVRIPAHPALEEKSPETFSGKVEVGSFTPELGEMEQPITDRGSSSHTSPVDALQATALSVEVNSSIKSGDIGEAVSLHSESAFAQLGQMTSEHGDQRWEEERQRHGAEQHEMGGRSEETVAETQLIVLDPEHPLVRRFQAALEDYLTKQLEKVSLEVQELRTATKKSEERKEELEGILYGEQQQLAQLQMELEKSRERCSQAATARQQVEGELEGLRLKYKKLCQERDDERKKVSAMQTQADDLALRLFHMQNMDEDMRHNLLLAKGATKKAEAQKVQAELEKRKQDLLVERLTKKADELQEQIALFEAQLVAQAEHTKVTRQAVNEVCMEIEAVNMEKKQLISRWNSSLIAMKQRDEAYTAAQELLSKYRHDLKSVEMDIESCEKSIRKEEEKNELLVTILSHSENDVSTTKKLIAQCLSKQEALKVECATYTRVLHETEETLNRTKMDQATLLKELQSINKDIEKATDAKVQMENEIMAKLQDQRMSSKAAKHFSQLVAKVHQRKTYLELHCSKLENDIAQVVLNTTQTNCRLTVHQNALCELKKEIKNVEDLIRHKESEIAKCRLLTEKKQRVLSQYNKKLEMILSQQEGQELGPLEIEINRLTKEIEEHNLKVTMLQKSWLNLQKEMVKLTHEQDEEIASLDVLKKQITILQQKKVRTENEIQQEIKEQKDIKHHMSNMRNELVKLNVLINKNNSNLEELRSGNIIMENEFVRSLREAEKESVEMQEKHRQLTKENERLLNSLVEAEQKIMLWGRKIQLAKEIRTTVNFEKGEIQAIRADVRRKQIRYGQLMKQQEKMVREMEAFVSRREMIMIRGESQKKTDKKRIPKSDVHRKNQDLRKQISETQEKIRDCDKTILELESAQASLSTALLEKQEEVHRLQAECNDLDSETECLRYQKRWNLLEIVALQTRQKRLQALKEGKYVPLCRTEEDWRKERQKLLDRLRTINAIIHRVQQEHPQHQRVLQWLSECLESKLASYED